MRTISFSAKLIMPSTGSSPPDPLTHRPVRTRRDVANGEIVLVCILFFEVIVGSSRMTWSSVYGHERKPNGEHRKTLNGVRPKRIRYVKRKAHTYIHIHFTHT